MKVTYNGYEIDIIDGEWEWQFDKDSFRFKVVFDIAGSGADPYTNHQTEVEAMYEALREPYKDLEIELGGQPLFSAVQATRTGGFNITTNIMRVSVNSAGSLSKFSVSFIVLLPADYQGTGIFQAGFSEFKCSVMAQAAGVQYLKFTGRFKGVEGDATGAKAAYIAAVETAIDTYYLATYFAGESFESLANNYDFDLPNKVLTFTIEYREVLVAYPTGGGTDWHLKELVMHERLGDQIGLVVDENNVASAVAFPPKRYECHGSIDVEKTVATGSDVTQLFETDIRPWLETIVVTQFGAILSMLDTVTHNYDPINNSLGFSMSWVSATHNIRAFGWKLDIDDDFGLGISKVGTGADHEKLIFPTGRVKSMFIVASMLAIDIPPAADFFDALCPPGVVFNPGGFEPLQQEGWLYLTRRPSFAAMLKQTDRQYTQYSGGFTASAVWFKTPSDGYGAVEYKIPSIEQRSTRP